MSPPVSPYLGVMPLSRINLQDTGEKRQAEILGGAVTAVAFVWNVFLKAEKMCQVIRFPNTSVEREKKKKKKREGEGAAGTG